jgi:hypothetical protein
VNVVLIYLVGGKAEDLLDYHCRYQDCFEPVNINTNASHLRKGLAKQLVTWLFPFCDEQGLDYKLMSSPIGRGLYKNCGFVEGVEGDKSAVQIDMGACGGSGMYEHGEVSGKVWEWQSRKRKGNLQTACDTIFPVMIAHFKTWRQT